MKSAITILAATLALLPILGCQSVPTRTSALTINNPGFEETDTKPAIPGWALSEHAGKWPGPAYEMILDTDSGSGSKHALRMTRIHKEVYGWAHQIVQISPEQAGRTLNFSALIKVRDVGPNGWLLIVNMNKRGQILKQFRSEPVTGTTDWQRISLKAPIPADTTEIDLGFILLDGGTAWGDDAEAHIE